MEKSTIIAGIVQSLIALVPSLILAWNAFKKDKSKPALRIIRKKGEIAKAELEAKTKKEKLELENSAKMEKLRLELKILEEEANYQNRLSDWESGEVVSAEKLGDKVSNLTNQISNLKEQGGQIIQEKIGGVKQAVEDLKSKRFYWLFIWQVKRFKG